MDSVTIASLSDQIFSYVAANYTVKVLAFTIHRQFTARGYSKVSINESLTEMIKNGTLEMDSRGFLKIGN